MVARTRSIEFNGISSPIQFAFLLHGCSAGAFHRRAFRFPNEATIQCSPAGWMWEGHFGVQGCISHAETEHRATPRKARSAGRFSLSASLLHQASRTRTAFHGNVCEPVLPSETSDPIRCGRRSDPFPGGPTATAAPLPWPARRHLQKTGELSSVVKLAPNRRISLSIEVTSQAAVSAQASGFSTCAVYRTSI